MKLLVCVFVAVSLMAAEANEVDKPKGEADESLSFLVIGDWGGQGSAPYTTPAEKSIAKQMGDTATQLNASFTMALGDNFYSEGVKNVDDPRFKHTFEDVFTASSLMNRWYVLAGNHDHYGNASAEVAYTKRSKRWYFPEFYYTENFTVPGGSSLQIVMIDTVLLAGLSHPVHRSQPPVPAHDERLRDAQLEWLEKTLSESTAKWLLVAGHYPVWSIAEHGPTQFLVDNIRPLLEKYHVTAYLCGHDHAMQYLRPDGQTVDYFVTGAGHLTDSSTAHMGSVPKGSLKFRYNPSDSHDSHGGFTSFQASAESLVATFIDYEGKVLYTAKNTSPRSMP